MKTIELTQGKVALVDDADFDLVSLHKWCALKSNHTFYAVRTEGRQMIYMHRAISGAPDGMRVDHWSRDGLDNRRENLRVCTPTQNAMNRGPRPGARSGYKGVHWSKPTGKWCARLRVDGKNKHLGLSACPAEAARIYDKAAREHHGEFAYLNFPEAV